MMKFSNLAETLCSSDTGSPHQCHQSQVIPVAGDQRHHGEGAVPRERPEPQDLPCLLWDAELAGGGKGRAHPGMEYLPAVLLY